MPEDLVTGKSPLQVHLQQRTDEVLGLLADPVPSAPDHWREAPTEDPLVLDPAWEGKTARQHLVEDDPQGPAVGLLVVGPAPGNLQACNLGCHVGRGPGVGPQGVGGAVDLHYDDYQLEIQERSNKLP